MAAQGVFIGRHVGLFLAGVAQPIGSYTEARPCDLALGSNAVAPVNER
jgi:hypothetical protein